MRVITYQLYSSNNQDWYSQCQKTSFGLISCILHKFHILLNLMENYGFIFYYDCVMNVVVHHKFDVLWL